MNEDRLKEELASAWKRLRQADYTLDALRQYRYAEEQSKSFNEGEVEKFTADACEALLRACDRLRRYDEAYPRKRDRELDPVVYGHPKYKMGDVLTYMGKEVEVYGVNQEWNNGLPGEFTYGVHLLDYVEGSEDDDFGYVEEEDLAFLSRPRKGTPRR